MATITKRRLVEGLIALGVRRGDCVMLHSSLSSLSYVKGGAATVMDAFLEAVGETGDLVVPSFRDSLWTGRFGFEACKECPGQDVCPGNSYYERIPITQENAAQLGADSRHIGGIKHSRDYIEARAAAGPMDPQVGVVRIDRTNGTPKAVLVHFTAHPAIEIEPPHVSPDYVGFAMKRIQHEVPGAVPVFCQGAAGAININNMFGTLEHAKHHGEALADEVLRVLDIIETTDTVEAKWTSRMVTDHGIMQ